jgi:hypothetical protein
MGFCKIHKIYLTHNIEVLRKLRNRELTNKLNSVVSRDSAVGVATGYGLDD